jgi:hypothetical protein
MAEPRDAAEELKLLPELVDDDDDDEQVVAHE